MLSVDDAAPTELYTLSLHDALPISGRWSGRVAPAGPGVRPRRARLPARSEEHTSELQSQSNLVCRLLLEKKNERVRTTAAPARQRHLTRHALAIRMQPAALGALRLW